MAEYRPVPDSELITVRNSARFFNWYDMSGYAVPTNREDDGASLVVQL